MFITFIKKKTDVYISILLFLTIDKLFIERRGQSGVFESEVLSRRSQDAAAPLF